MFDDTSTYGEWDEDMDEGTKTGTKGGRATTDDTFAEDEDMAEE